MPSVSLKQQRTMRAISHGWTPPASSGIHIPLAVAQEFAAADEAGGFRNRRAAAPFWDVATAEVLKDLARHIEDKSSAAIPYLTAGQSALVTGEGYFRFVTEYEDEISDKQKIVIKPCSDMFSVYLGPHVMPDGSDAEYGFILEDIPEERFKREFPDAKKKSEDFPEEGSANWRSEGAIRIAEYFYFNYEDALVLYLSDENATP